MPPLPQPVEARVMTLASRTVTPAADTGKAVREVSRSEAEAELPRQGPSLR